MMKTNMKWIFCVTIAGLLILCAAGCTQNNTASGEGENSEGEGEAAEGEGTATEGEGEGAGAEGEGPLVGEAGGPCYGDGTCDGVLVCGSDNQCAPPAMEGEGEGSEGEGTEGEGPGTPCADAGGTCTETCPAGTTAATNPSLACAGAAQSCCLPVAAEGEGIEGEGAEGEGEGTEGEGTEGEGEGTEGEGTEGEGEGEGVWPPATWWEGRECRLPACDENVVLPFDASGTWTQTLTTVSHSCGQFAEIGDPRLKAGHVETTTGMVLAGKGECGYNASQVLTSVSRGYTTITCEGLLDQQGVYALATSVTTFSGDTGVGTARVFLFDLPMGLADCYADYDVLFTRE